MTNLEFVDKAIIAANSKTIYVQGCFGDAMNSEAVKNYHVKRFSNYKRKDDIMSASDDTFGFDCVCLIKGIVWGWNANNKAPHGGASYCSGILDDVTIDTLEKLCNVSDDFSTVDIGEILFMPGHVGIYIGCGTAIEATTKWDGGVQYSAVSNMGMQGVKVRAWRSHGRIPGIEYVQDDITLHLPIIKKGVKSEYVRNVQRLLIARGYSCGKCGADGSFGGDTQKSVIDFQRDMYMPETGEIGTPEITALLGVE